MTLFARREAKTRIRQRDWLKLAGEKIPREQVGAFLLFCLFAQIRQVENRLKAHRILLASNTSNRS